MLGELPVNKATSLWMLVDDSLELSMRVRSLTDVLLFMLVTDDSGDVNKGESR